MNIDEKLKKIASMFNEAIKDFETDGVTAETRKILDGIHKAAIKGVTRIKDIPPREPQKLPDVGFDISKYLPQGADKVIKKFEEKIKNGKENLSKADAKIKAQAEEIENLKKEIEALANPEPEKEDLTKNDLSENDKTENVQTETGNTPEKEDSNPEPEKEGKPKGKKRGPKPKK